MTDRNGKAFRLDGEIAVVTGGATGLGRAMAGVLAGQGAHVAILDIDAAGAAAAASEIEGDGGSAEAHRLDVTDESAVDAVMETLATGHGRLDILVNNAGIAERMPATEMPREAWERVMGNQRDGRLPLRPRGGASHDCPEDQGTYRQYRLDHGLFGRDLSECFLQHLEGSGRQPDPGARPSSGRPTASA